MTTADRAARTSPLGGGWYSGPGAPDNSGAGGGQGSHQVTWKACRHPWRLQVMQAPEAALLSRPCSSQM